MAMDAMKEAALRGKVQEILLDELRSNGYAPNPKDVVGATARVIALIKQESGQGPKLNAPPAPPNSKSVEAKPAVAVQVVPKHN